MTNTSVNPARSTGPALFVGGWALAQLWLFWLAPILGGILGGVSVPVDRRPRCGGGFSRHGSTRPRQPRDRGEEGPTPCASLDLRFGVGWARARSGRPERSAEPNASVTELTREDRGGQTISSAGVVYIVDDEEAVADRSRASCAR